MIKDRILCLIKEKGLTKRDFCEKIGISPSVFSGNAMVRPLNSNILEKVLEFFPRVNAKWVITGEGRMMDDNPLVIDFGAATLDLTYYNNIRIWKNIIANDPNPIKNYGVLPYSMISIGKDSYIFGGCTDAIRVYGNYMEPKFPGGSYVVLRNISIVDIILSKPYCVVAEDDLCLLCYVGEVTNDILLCQFEGSEYSPIIIEKKIVKKIFEVIGVFMEL